MLQVESNDRCDSAHSPALKAFEATPLPGTISKMGTFQIDIKSFLLEISVEMHWGFLKPLQ